MLTAHKSTGLDEKEKCQQDCTEVKVRVVDRKVEATTSGPACWHRRRTNKTPVRRSGSRFAIRSVPSKPQAALQMLHEVNKPCTSMDRKGEWHGRQRRR
jgi:hypothetical protein